MPPAMSTGNDYCVIFALHASSRWLPRRMRAARAREIYFFLCQIVTF